MADWDFPNALVQVEFTAGVWTDLIARVRTFSYTRGRGSERERPEAGRATVVFDNYDRQLEPKNPSSTYWPNVRPIKRARLIGVVGTAQINLFSGVVETWEIAWGENGFDATVTMELVDGFGVLALSSPAVYTAEVLKDKPIAYWKLGERVGSTILADSAPGGNYDLIAGIGVTMGATPGPLGGGATVLQCAGGISDMGAATELFTSDVRFLTNPAVEFWVKPDTLAAGRRLAVIWDTAGISAFDIFIADSAGHLTLRFYAAGYVLHTTTTLTISAGVWTHIVAAKDFTSCRWFKNGVLIETTTVAAASHSVFLSDVRFIVAGDGQANEALDGTMAHVAIYDQGFVSPGVAVTPIIAGRVATHYAKGFGDVAPAPSSDQIAVILDAFGWPAPDRDIETGIYSLSGFTPSETALDILYRIASSEGGLFFINAAGQAAFYANDHASPTGLVFGTAAGQLKFEDMKLDYDEVQLWNDVTITAPSALNKVEDPPTVQELEDPRSIGRYYRRQTSIDTVLANVTDVGKRAREMLVNYREPRQRIVSIEHTRAQQNSWDELLAVDLLDEIALIVTPPGGGTPITQQSRIERITLSSDDRQDWKLHWDLSALARKNLLSHEQASPDVGTVALSVILKQTAVAGSASTLVAAVGAPAFGQTIWVAVHNSKAAAPDIPTLTGTNGYNTTWTRRSTTVNGIRRLSVFSGVASSAVAGDLTVAFGGATQTGIQLLAVEVDGPVSSQVPVQLVTATGTSSSAAATLAAFANALDGVLAFMASSTTSQNVTPGAGFSELAEVSNGTLPGTLEAEWRPDNDTTVTWTNAADPWIAVGIELANETAANALWIPLANSVITRVTSPVLAGLGALRMAATAAGNMSIETAVASLPSVVVGTKYMASAFFLSPGASRLVHVEIRWFNAANTFLSASVGADITDDTLWRGAWCEGTVPANATKARVALVVKSAAAGEAHYADEILFTLDD